MPNYDYVCTVCGHTFEAFQKMTDKLLSRCPKCKKKLRRIISGGTGFIFKGSGFYETDYKKKTPPPKEESGAKNKGQSACTTCPKTNAECPSKSAA
ncbi:MAG: zinc ribbon domain-containing protein [Candidatus Omnitrophica bacterium]|nr:zinc ribbon domain-containing protein [Candidatus Omnitrophota bacterium]